MKTLEDFKGTRETLDWAEGSKAVIVYKACDEPSDELYNAKRELPTVEDIANFKLFANSYKLLEKACKALDELRAHKARLLDASGFPEEDIKMLLERNEFLKEFEQAIQDCL